MDPTDTNIDWWRRHLYLILDHYVIEMKSGPILRVSSFTFQRILEDFIESAIAGDESHETPKAERPANTKQQEHE